jgi:hypothetical protein
MAAPTSDTDGFALNGARYVNVWAQASDATSTNKYILYVYVYRTGIGWVRYVEGVAPYLNVFVATNGLLLELELRGVERVYLRRVGNTSPNVSTSTFMIEGFTYR